MLKLKFKKRNKSIENNLPYGAKELKRFYQKYISRGLLLAIIIHIIAVGAFTFSIYLEGLNADKIDKNDKVIPIITLEEYDIPQQVKEEETKQPEAIVKVIPKMDLEALTPEPVKRIESETETIKNQSQLEDVKVPVSSTGEENASNTIGEGEIKFNPNVKTEEEIVKEPVKNNPPSKDIFETYEADKSPSAMNLSAIQRSMIYPQSALEMGIEGRVTARVLVGKDGGVDKVGSLSGPSVFHNEVRDKISGLRFTPATVKGNPVKCWVSVPFNFKISNKFKSNDE